MWDELTSVEPILAAVRASLTDAYVGTFAEAFIPGAAEELLDPGEDHGGDGPGACAMTDRYCHEVFVQRPGTLDAAQATPGADQPLVVGARRALSVGVPRRRDRPAYRRGHAMVPAAAGRRAARGRPFTDGRGDRHHLHRGRRPPDGPAPRPRPRMTDLEARLADAAEAAILVPDQDDLLDARVRSAQLAADLHLVAIDLRSELRRLQD